MPEPEIEFTEECDIGQYFRAWLLSIPQVSAYFGPRIVDTLPSECNRPFVWYSLEDANENGTLCDGVGFEDYDYLLEIVGPPIELPQLRRMKKIITDACQSYERGEPFGHDDLSIQSLEVQRLKDSYTPTAPLYFANIAFTAMAIQITP